MDNNNDNNDNNNTVELTALGFCGADDSIHPYQLAMYCQSYPKVEFGILFRPDKEGTPRYASPEWVEQLAQTVQCMKKQNNVIMKLAAHLCSTRVNDILNGDDVFVQYLIQCGFQRIQINATEVNGVDTTKLSESVPKLYTIIIKYPQIEFILQKNLETKPLCDGIEELLLKNHNDVTTTTMKVTNVAMLVDESKGTGILSSSWPIPSSTVYKIGYAGGIGPNNVQSVLQDITKVVVQKSSNNTQKQFWIDMESSLRSNKNNIDIFDLDKCYQVINTVCSLGLMQHPSYLQK